MTDKPRLIDADKLLKWMFNREESRRQGAGGRSVFYQSLYSSINDGDFDPDPPQQPDIQVGERNWQEDMNLCLKVDEAWSRELFIADQPDITIYWLQQYDIELRGRIRWSEVAKGLGDDLEQQGKEMIRLQKVIQQKDAEIARLKKSIEGLQLITKIERSTRVQPEHTSFLRDKGNKL
ncbi:hypothetical protein [Paenibacillus sp. FSL M7-0134]|uniref:hypothetical protein n=1 Tax=Paenibacillus sp. FSL M7-0134 TaxID=2954754 RepID=UPI0030F61A4E